MKLVRGDRVKFLNENGKGIITDILSSSRIIVRIEDGFEIPCLMSDVIKDEEMSVFTEKINKNEDIIPKENRENDKEYDLSENIQASALSKNRLLDYERQGIYISAVPHNQKILTSGNLDIIIINHTPAELLYTLYIKDERKYNAKSYGIVDSESKLIIDTIDFTEIYQWDKGLIQIMYFDYKNNIVIEPLKEEFHLKFHKTLKLENFKSSAFFEEERAVVINLHDYERHIKESQNYHIKDSESNITSEVLTEAITQKKHSNDNANDTFINEFIKDEGYAVVDMHIWEIEENYSRLSPNEIFKLQMIFFNKCLESALSNRLRKVVFIHGVGNGTLKKEIRNTIEQDFPEISVFDAAMDKYGIGATEINIPYNYKISD